MDIKKEINILIIDDDYIARLINKNIVQSFDQFSVCVYEASGGNEALKLIRSKYQSGDKFPDLIILDIAMPNMSGFDFIQELKLWDPSISNKIIIVSAYPEGKERAKSLGIKYLLGKPVIIEQFKSVIQEMLSVK